MIAAQAQRRGAASIVAGEYPLTEADFRRIAGLLREQSGIHLPESKAALVYSRLAKRLRVLGLGSFSDYCDMVAAPESAEERSAMLAALTTNVTRFFREPHHFDDLHERVSRTLAPAARAGARIRIWSSACSSGEEPYSIALIVLAALPEAASLDVRILATDIDPVVIARAKAGLYDRDAVSTVPQALRERGFVRPKGDENRLQVSDEVRALVTFRELNLIGDWPMRGRFDVIFCRNVVIYFEEATQNRVWSRFRDYLEPDGRLYIGHSERIDTPGFESDGLTIYRLAGARR